MQSILLAIKRPLITGNLDADNAAIGKWNKSLEQFDRDAETNKGCERLNLGTYLIHSNDGLKTLADGIHLAFGNKLECRVFFVEKDAQLQPSQSTP
jgi:hypothetical protein